jgi:hypothetical protein
MNGTYVFSAHGLNSKNNFAVAGEFTADGKGNITSGTRDTVNDGGGQNLGESITGSYSVNQDGRGLLILNGGSGQAIYFFVLQSPSAGKLFQDGTTSNSVVADAVGTIQAQTGPPAASGTYVVRLDGEDVNLSPYGAIGGLSFSGGTPGTITGLYDENDAGSISQQLSASGTYSLSSGRGSATLTTPNGTHNFIAYYVSPNRLELLSTNTNFFLYGHADLQTSVSASTAAFLGPQVFNLSGLDGSPSVSAYPIVQTGRFTLDGSGTLSNTTAIMDYNSRSAFFSPTFDGTFSVTGATPGGRWSASLNGFSGGPITNENLVGWQVSPQQSIVLAVSGANSNIADYAVVETGDMRAQTLVPSAASINGNYAQSFSGYDTSMGNLESTGNYLASSSGTLNGTLSGTIDFQTDGQGLVENSAQNGSYTVDPNLGRGAATVSGVPVIFYTGASTNVAPPNTDTIYIISSDSASGYQGSLILQQP